ncbi:putative nucleic acid-binding protein [Salinibacter ruber]|uniref:type II toxin-antitoxin system VapC family toxin n=1 Tax=Salinibacter ruber TaxID=146919 RepID=UPI00216A5112|nr:putative nucleic acid-binding protein [Salinibacter ruber]MCS3821550.1 putative nucleic acid-binding protein [Salinibacter ruber]MCS4182590.1 putative nucleic acid-binding protein [Salinibacter ruber]MCS4190394.1 putative nucleic acid-binding protein [Salinibacter ruber]
MDTLTIPRCGDYYAESLIERAEERLRALRPPVLSWLTDVEMHSALAKKVRRGELAEEDAERVQDLFRTHVSHVLYEVAATEHGDFVQARQWIARMDTALRTLDALHLAVAHRQGLEVLTADEGLADAGRTFELDVELMRAGDSS